LDSANRQTLLPAIRYICVDRVSWTCLQSRPTKQHTSFAFNLLHYLSSTYTHNTTPGRPAWQGGHSLPTYNHLVCATGRRQGRAAAGRRGISINATTYRRRWVPIPPACRACLPCQFLLLASLSWDLHTLAFCFPSPSATPSVFRVSALRVSSCCMEMPTPHAHATELPRQDGRAGRSMARALL